MNISKITSAANTASYANKIVANMPTSANKYYKLPGGKRIIEPVIKTAEPPKISIMNEILLTAKERIEKIAGKFKK